MCIVSAGILQKLIDLDYSDGDDLGQDRPGPEHQSRCIAFQMQDSVFTVPLRQVRFCWNIKRLKYRETGGILLKYKERGTICKEIEGVYAQNTLFLTINTEMQNSAFTIPLRQVWFCYNIKRLKYEGIEI